MSRNHQLVKHLSSSSYTLVYGGASVAVSPISCLKSKAQYGIGANKSILALFSPLKTSYCTSSLAAPPDSTHSSSSPYLSVRIRCPKHVSDMLSEALLCFGATSTSVDQQDDSDTSTQVCIDSIFPECENVDMCLAQAADSIGLKKIPAYEVKIGQQYDWVRKTQESFHPVEVTEGVWIVPEWKSPPDAGATNIIVNPGLAFGTGEHPTTKLCLLLLRGMIKGGELFLDYGTGSGILGIAAVKFGASMSVGVDVDPQAIASARHNASLNNIGPERMELLLVPSNPSSNSVSEREKYDVVVANILLNPLLELADHIVSYARPGALVALSGILSEQVPYIKNRYSALLEDILVSEMDGWSCVSGRKINLDLD
ncbi:ribosomal protein L11 methyltransferase-related [Euphorbia peplus]|nr:ribosomal protein L11 methyltransferase-related [Euphorbia peplus]